VHPDGTRIYAILTKEAAVAVIDTASWSVVDRIEIGTNPTTPFVRTLA
jgi:YVTN family beta-propeller protein